MKIRIAFTYDVPKDAECIFRMLYRVKKRMGDIPAGVKFSQWLREELDSDAYERVLYSAERAADDLIHNYDIAPAKVRGENHD